MILRLSFYTLGKTHPLSILGTFSHSKTFEDSHYIYGWNHKVFRAFWSVYCKYEVFYSRFSFVLRSSGAENGMIVCLRWKMSVRKKLDLLEIDYRKINLLVEKKREKIKLVKEFVIKRVDGHWISIVDFLRFTELWNVSSFTSYFCIKVSFQFLNKTPLLLVYVGKISGCFRSHLQIAFHKVKKKSV